MLSASNVVVVNNMLYFQGVGDSAQGFTNCVLFCALTSRVRQHIGQSICRVCSRRPSPTHNPENCTTETPGGENIPMQTFELKDDME